MKKLHLAVVLIFLAVLIYVVSKSPRVEVKNFPSPNSGVVAFGDSLTYGTGSKEGGGYVKMLSEDLDVPITNLGVVGNTTFDALRRIDTVTSRKPKVTIVLLGGNDFLKGISEKQTFENLGKIIETIQSSGSIVLLVGLQPLVSKNHEREQFDQVAKQYQVAYVPDILHGIYGNLTLMSDSLHPNDKGYRIMANKIEPILSQLMR